MSVSILHGPYLSRVWNESEVLVALRLKRCTFSPEILAFPKFDGNHFPKFEKGVVISFFLIGGRRRITIGASEN